MYAGRLLLAITFALVAGGAHARSCPARRYLVTSDATPLGGAPVFLGVDTTTVTLNAACPPTAATRRGAQLVITWDACAGRTGLRLKARLAKTCNAIRGRLRARGLKTRFTAVPSTCGDGLVDEALGEACDGTPCPADVACTACRCDAGLCTDEAVTGEGAAVHVAEGSTIPFTHNPPTSGPHYPVWASYRTYSAAVPRGYWVHNLEHGGVVFLYRPDAGADAIAALTAAYQSLPNDPACGHRRAILTPDPQLDSPFSVVAWQHELVCSVVDAAAIQQFVADHRNRGPEDVCANGGYVP